MMLGRLLTRNPLEILWITVLCFAAILAPFITRFDPYSVDLSQRLGGVSSVHFFGTDEFGRDLFTRVVYGTRVVIYAILFSAILSAFGGTTLGLLSGYFGKKLDFLLSRLIDALQSFSATLIGIMLAAAMGPSLNTAILAIGLYGTPALARVVRGEVLRLREMTYTEASRALGAGHFHIIAKVILPNVLSPIIIQTSAIAPRAVVAVAGLSFLGLGAQPPQASWGAMIAAARPYMYEHPLYLLVLISLLSITIISLNLLGDGIRDILAKKTRL